MGSDHVTLLHHTDVWWLSRGKVLTRLFLLCPFGLFHRLRDEDWLIILAYLGEVFPYLNELNLGLQGMSTTIFNVQDKVEAMIRNFVLWFFCINKKNTEAFSSLHDFLLANKLSLTNGVKCDIMKHLSELATRLRRYFPKTDNANNWFRHPPAHF